MKVTNYGDLIAGVLKYDLLAYEEFGSYQGDYVAVLRDQDGYIHVFKGSYGSCSGCDWLEGERDYETDEVPDDSAAEYVAQIGPSDHFAVMHADVARAAIEAGTFLSMLPANTRNDLAKDYSDVNEESLVSLVGKALDLTSLAKTE